MDRFEHSIVVEAPVEVCYARWHRFEDFPEFMNHVDEVSRIEEGRLHWVVEGPLGKKLEWDAVIDEDVENRRIAWHSKSEDPEMSILGDVRFEELGPERTRVTASMQYEAPFGAVGDMVAGLFSNPQAMVTEDMENFKRLVEEGLSGYTGPFDTEPALPDDAEPSIDLESGDPLDQVGTPYLGADGALGTGDELDMRQDLDRSVSPDEDVYGQEFVEVDIFTTSMDAYSEDMESFVEDLDEDIDSSYVLGGDLEAYLEEGEGEAGAEGNLAVPLSEGRGTESGHIGGTDSPGTGEELQR